MKRLIIAFIALPLLLTQFSCQNAGRDMIEDEVDEAHEVNDNMYEGTTMEEAADFMVDYTNSSMMLVKLSNAFKTQTEHAELQDFAGSIMKEHEKMNEEIRKMAEEMNVILPDNISNEKELNLKNFVKDESVEMNSEEEYLEMLIDLHEEFQSELDKTIEVTEQEEIRVFAEKVRTHVQKHLEKARKYEEKYAS